MQCSYCDEELGLYVSSLLMCREVCDRVVAAEHQWLL
jgi:hypothetical protein